MNFLYITTICTFRFSDFNKCVDENNNKLCGLLKLILRLNLEVRGRSAYLVLYLQIKIIKLKFWVRPSIRFLDPLPPPINFVHDHLFFSKFIIYFFVI